jgi:formate hydrogenlyase subunit 6/NADH:ubiquinone oxidoreductase subunit I
LGADLRVGPVKAPQVSLKFFCSIICFNCFSICPTYSLVSKKEEARRVAFKAETAVKEAKAAKVAEKMAAQNAQAAAETAEEATPAEEAAPEGETSTEA